MKHKAKIKLALLKMILNLQVSECAPKAVAHGYLTDSSRSWSLPHCWFMAVNRAW